MLIGMGTRIALLPLSTAALREVDILGSFRYADTYPQALALLASPSSGLRTMVSKLVTHRFGLSDTKKAFEMLAQGVDDKGELVLKVMVGPGAEKEKKWSFLPFSSLGLSFSFSFPSSLSVYVRQRMWICGCFLLWSYTFRILLTLAPPTHHPISFSYLMTSLIFSRCFGLSPNSPCRL